MDLFEKFLPKKKDDFKLLGGITLGNSFELNEFLPESLLKQLKDSKSLRTEIDNKADIRPEHSYRYSKYHHQQPTIQVIKNGQEYFARVYTYYYTEDEKPADSPGKFSQFPLTSEEAKVLLDKFKE